MRKNIDLNKLPQVIIIGDANVGKSSLVSYCQSGKASTLYENTLNIKKTGISMKNSFGNYIIIDTPGENTSMIYPKMIEQANIIVLMYSIISRVSYQSIQSHLNQIVDGITLNSEKKPHILLLGNKQDLHLKREVSQNECNELIVKKSNELKGKVKKIQYLPVSVLFKPQSCSCFTQKIEQIIKSFTNRPEIIDQPTSCVCYLI